MSVYFGIPMGTLPDSAVTPEPLPELRCRVLQRHARGSGAPDFEVGEIVLVEGRLARARAARAVLEIIDPPKRQSRAVVVEALKPFRFPGNPRREPAEPGRKYDMDANDELDDLIARGAARIVAEIS